MVKVSSIEHLRRFKCTMYCTWISIELFFSSRAPQHHASLCNTRQCNSPTIHTMETVIRECLIRCCFQLWRVASYHLVQLVKQRRPHGIWEFSCRNFDLQIKLGIVFLWSVERCIKNFDWKMFFIIFSFGFIMATLKPVLDKKPWKLSYLHVRFSCFVIVW